MTLQPNAFRSNHRRCSVKNDVLRNFAKFTGKHLCQSLFFNKVASVPATLLIKSLWHRCFPVNFAKFVRTLFFAEHLRTTASVLCQRQFESHQLKFVQNGVAGFNYYLLLKVNQFINKRELQNRIFMHSSCVVFILFNTDLYKSVFSTYFFKLVFRFYVSYIWLINQFVSLHLRVLIGP